MKLDQQEIGVGATEELSLRVSVATLARVLFDNPEDGRRMLALERTATLREIEGRPEVTVKAKPLGGAVRIINSQALKGLIGDFHYDSEQSCNENDFRILISPVSWEKVKEVCQEHLKEIGNGILNSSPERELEEEFQDTLNVRLTPEQYQLKPGDIIVEDLPGETDNVRAESLPTVRIYYIFEAWIESHEIIAMMLANHRRYSDKDLRERAWRDVRHGGRGRSNAILILGLDDVKNAFRSIPAERRGKLIQFDGHQLDGNVLAILEEIDSTRYHR